MSIQYSTNIICTIGQTPYRTPAYATFLAFRKERLRELLNGGKNPQSRSHKTGGLPFRNVSAGAVPATPGGASIGGGT